jgi:hypothetical protein
MRNLLLSLCLTLLLPLTTSVSARAEDEVKPAAAEEAAAEEAAAKDAAAAAPKAKADDKPFTPPPGWREKKRGQYTVYCRKQSVQGTRVPKEVCYDEEGINAMLAAQAEDREKVDQMRRICSSQAACGSN